MSKKVTSIFMAALMVLTCVFTQIPAVTVHAFSSYQVEVTKDNAPIRNGYYQSKKIVRRVSKGTILTVIDEKTNLKFNKWYKVGKKEYIFSGNVKKVQKPHTHSYKRTGYEKAHPHYAIYDCSCGQGGYCSNTETKKQAGCNKCYPPEEAKLKPYAPDIPVINPEQTVKEYQRVHEHKYNITGYANEHPHYAQKECSCGSKIKGNETTRKDGCETCYPPIAKVIESMPDRFSHECKYVAIGSFAEHPHYTKEKCEECGNIRTNTYVTKFDPNCSICTSPFKTGIDYTDLTGRLYDLSNGYTWDFTNGQKKELYDFASDLHASLDICGLVFDGCDLLNVAFYIVEGKWADAALSGVAVIPYIGIVTPSGKAIAKSGKITVDAAQGTGAKIVRETTEDVGEKVATKITKDVVTKNLGNLSDTAKAIVKNSDDYSEGLLRTIKKISENQKVDLSDAFYKKQLLLGKDYSAEIVTKSGLRYANVRGENRIMHIVERHGLYSSDATRNHFKVAGKQIFDIIDDVVLDGNIIAKSQSKNGNMLIDYMAPYVIGSNGEMKLRLITYEGKVVTAFPMN